MGRHDIIRLHEAEGLPSADARVIDVAFREVARRSWWDRTKAGLQALLWAAAIGFLIPPAWVLVQRVGELLRLY